MSASTLFNIRRLPRALTIVLILISIVVFLKQGLSLYPRTPRDGEMLGEGEGMFAGGEFMEYEILDGGPGGLGSAWKGQGGEDGGRPPHGPPEGDRMSFWKRPLVWLSHFFPFAQFPSSAPGHAWSLGHDLSYQTFAPMDPDPLTLPEANTIFPDIVLPEAGAEAELPKSWTPFPVDEAWEEIYPSKDKEKLKTIPPLKSTKDPIPTDSFSYTWKRPEWYAAALDGGYPEEIPKVQFDFAAARRSQKGVDSHGRGIGWETQAERSTRLERQAAVKRAFMYAWDGYKANAWGHDEVRPVSETTSDAFQGWGASIIDSLETLLIMNLTGEYELARRHVNMVDFRLVNGRDWAFGWRTKPGGADEEDNLGNKEEEEEEQSEGATQMEQDSDSIPVGSSATHVAKIDQAESVLKGLLAQKEEDAMDEATIGSTPMPESEDDDEDEQEQGEEEEEEMSNEDNEGEFSLHEIVEKRQIPGPSDHRPKWNWRRKGSEEAPHIVAGRDVRSRVGTFETGIRYLGGLMGAYDLSGDELMLDRAKDMAEVLLRSFDTLSGLPVNSFDAGSADYWYASARVSLAEVGSMTLELTRLSQVTGDPKYFDRAQRAIDYLEQVVLPKSVLKPLIPFFFDSNVRAQRENPEVPLHGGYGFGAMADSYYEYLIKQHQLIGGATDQYKNLYSGSIDQAYRYLIKESHVVPDRDLLIFGTSQEMRFTPVVDHLTCFAGGMLGLGSRLLDRPRDLEFGQRVADTCYWVGASTPTGLQPESATFYDDDDEDRFQNITVIIPSKKVGEPHQQVEREILRGAVPGAKSMVNWYIGRPETAESVFYMYRLTGDKKWQDKGWRMFTSWINACRAPAGMSSAKDVRSSRPGLGDNMESFVFAETLKYYYLLQSDPELISLDDYVFTTEAHPLLLRNQRPGTSKFWDPVPSHLERLNGKLGQTARGSDAQLFERLAAIRAESRKIAAFNQPMARPKPEEQGDGGRFRGGGGMGGGGGNPDIRPKPPSPEAHRGPQIRPKPVTRPGGHQEGKMDDEP